MDGEVAGTGVSITDARRTVGGPHTDGGSTPHVTARLGVILVAAQYIEVGEDLIRIRDPALIKWSLHLRAIGFVSLTIAILVPFVHQHAVIHPVDPNVVGGQAAAHVRHYDGTVVPQVALALTREGDVAIGEADRLGGGDKQPHLLHQLAICQDLEPGLSFCQPLQLQPILDLALHQLQARQRGVGDAIAQRDLLVRHLADQQRLRHALAAEQLLLHG
ncbi:hypothetical protein D3C85_1328810 [compost metagenome]